MTPIQEIRQVYSANSFPFELDLLSGVKTRLGIWSYLDHG